MNKKLLFKLFPFFFFFLSSSQCRINRIDQRGVSPGARGLWGLEDEAQKCSLIENLVKKNFH